MLRTAHPPLKGHYAVKHDHIEYSHVLIVIIVVMGNNESMIAFVIEYLRLANELIGEDKPEGILALQVVCNVHPSKDVVAEALRQLAEVVTVWGDLDDMLEELGLL